MFFHHLLFILDRNWFVDAGCNLQQSFVCKANFGPKPERPSDDRGDYLDCPGGWTGDGQTIYCLKDSFLIYDYDVVVRKIIYES